MARSAPLPPLALALLRRLAVRPGCLPVGVRGLSSAFGALNRRGLLDVRLRLSPAGVAFLAAAGPGPALP